MKVLIIDDNESITDLFSKYLTKNGFDCTVCNNGADGLKKILNEKYDAILLDLAMPEVTGFDIIDDLEKNKLLGKNNIIVLTASSEQRVSFENLLSRGVRKCLKKPIKMKELLGVINETVKTLNRNNSNLG